MMESDYVFIDNELVQELLMDGDDQWLEGIEMAECGDIYGDDNQSIKSFDIKGMVEVSDDDFDEVVLALASEQGILINDIDPPTDIINNKTKESKKKKVVLSEEAIKRQHPKGPRKIPIILGACKIHQQVIHKKIAGDDCNKCNKKWKKCNIPNCPCRSHGTLWFTSESQSNEKVFLHQDVGDDEIRVVHLRKGDCHTIVQKRRDILNKRNEKKGKRCKTAC